MITSTDNKRGHVYDFIYTKGKICEIFVYTKIQKTCKNLKKTCYVFMYKKQDTLRCAIFHESLKLAFI